MRTWRPDTRSPDVRRIDTTTTRDQPDERGTQLLAAHDYVTEESPVRDRVDPDRLAVMGHSMGGGGCLEAAAERTSSEAAIPLTGYDLDRTWPEVQAAPLVSGAENDTTAPVSRHSVPFYESRRRHPLHAVPPPGAAGRHGAVGRAHELPDRPARVSARPGATPS